MPRATALGKHAAALTAPVLPPNINTLFITTLLQWQLTRLDFDSVRSQPGKSTHTNKLVCSPRRIIVNKSFYSPQISGKAILAVLYSTSSKSLLLCGPGHLCL